MIHKIDRRVKIIVVFIFSGKIFSTTLLFPILKISKKSSNIDIEKRTVSFKKIILKISATENFAFKIRNSRVVETILLEKISHDLQL